MYAQVYEILNGLGKNYINRIPKYIFKQIEENRNKKSLFKFDLNKSIDEQNITNDTIEFISFLNLNYWCDEEEKRRLMRIYSENEKRRSKELEQKYDVRQMFLSKNKNSTNNINMEEFEMDKTIPKDIATIKEGSFIKRIICKFKKILER